jgi:two-component system chemotaxis sensor kinase CheA
MEDTPGEEFRLALRELAEEANRHGRPDLADAAAVLNRELTDGLSDAPARAQSGVEQLQRLLELASSQPAGDASPCKPAASAEDKTPVGAPNPPAPARIPNAIAQDPELLGDFILEAREHLSSIETNLLELEQDPQRAEAIHAVFRSFHTIKGLAGFLELAAIQQVAHDTETALDLARNGALALNPEVIDTVLAAADYLKYSISRLDAVLAGRSAPPEQNPGALLVRVRALAQPGSTSPGAPLEKPSSPAPMPAPLPSEPAPTAIVDPASLAKRVPPPVAEVEPAPEPAKASANVPKNDKLRSDNAATRSVKVDTSKLDFLVDMVGELVIAQAMVRHDPSLGKLSSQKLQRNLSQMARITADVQKTAMAMRMVPVGSLFQRTARLVRDLSRKAGKRVELVTEGEETELDRTIVEEVADPLMHMVRNSIDHGLETPGERARSGKPAVGTIKLKAWHQAGHIVIEVSDDGRGLDRDRILNKARQRGLIGSNETPSDAETWALIFEPGLSTAEQVTDISGRGVGMDVVRKHIQKLRGRVETRSVKGKGTDFVLKLPLTLAIIDGLVVKTGEERYIVPLFAVSEMLRPTPEMMWTVQGKEEMALVRGKLIPVVRLYRRFGVQPRSEDACQSLLVVTESGGRPFCLMVDELIGKQEVVIKSLGETMKQVPGIAGGAILGDGRVGLILDVEGIFGRKADG